MEPVCQLSKKRAEYMVYKTRLLEMVNGPAVALEAVEELDRAMGPHKTQQDQEMVRALRRFAQGDAGPVIAFRNRSSSV